MSRPALREHLSDLFGATAGPCEGCENLGLVSFDFERRPYRRQRGVDEAKRTCSMWSVSVEVITDEPLLDREGCDYSVGHCGCEFESAAMHRRSPTGGVLSPGSLNFGESLTMMIWRSQIGRHSYTVRPSSNHDQCPHEGHSPGTRNSARPSRRRISLPHT